MKIGLISPPLLTTPPRSYGGLELVVWNLANALGDMGHEVVLVAGKGSRKPPNGVLVETVEPPERVNVDWLELEKKAYAKYKHILDDDSIHIWHDHSWLMFIYLYKRDVNPDLKVIHTHHSFANFRTLPVPKPNFVALSKWHAYALSRQVPGSTWRYCYNGIDIDESSFRSDKEDFYVFLGRISPIKAPDVAIWVAREASVRLYVIGGDKFVDDPGYVEKVKSLCDGEQIIYLGEQPRDVVTDYLSRAKALLFTNDPIRFMEPFGLVLCEAMSLGTPVIAINNGAVAEVVNNGKTGFVVQSPIDMVNIIREGLIEEIKPKDCLEWVKNNFSKEVMARNYLNLYESVLDGDEW